MTVTSWFLVLTCLRVGAAGLAPTAVVPARPAVSPYNVAAQTPAVQARTAVAPADIVSTMADFVPRLRGKRPTSPTDAGWKNSPVAREEALRSTSPVSAVMFDTSPKFDDPQLSNGAPSVAQSGNEQMMSLGTAWFLAAALAAVAAGRWWHQRAKTARSRYLETEMSVSKNTIWPAQPNLAVAVFASDSVEAGAFDPVELKKDGLKLSKSVDREIEHGRQAFLAGLDGSEEQHRRTLLVAMAALVPFAGASETLAAPDVELPDRISEDPYELIGMKNPDDSREDKKVFYMKKKYREDTYQVLNHMKISGSLDKGTPNMARWNLRVKEEMDDWVAMYRRQDMVVGRQSYYALYSAVNTLASHFTSYGPKFPFPSKRRPRLYELVNQTEKYLEKGK